MKKSILFILVVISIAVLFIGRFDLKPGKAMVISISTDGHYALSSHLNRFIILWDLQNGRKKIISRCGNIYSAYFIKNTYNYMWQDLSGVVHIQNVTGKEIQTFKNFQTYGHVITSDLKYYFSADINWNLFEGTNNRRHLIQRGFYDFKSIGKLKNLILSRKDKYLIATGYGSKEIGIVLWDAQTFHPIKIFHGNYGKTTGAISPDQQQIITGDENSNVFVWHCPTGRFIFRLWSFWNGRRLKRNSKTGLYEYDLANQRINPPKNDYFSRQNKQAHVISLKFIAQNYYLRFITRIPYAVLYKLNDPKSIKYLNLGNHPLPSVSDYSRNQALDTAPLAHLLVMALENGGGIIIYRFDGKKKSLQRLACLE